LFRYFFKSRVEVVHRLFPEQLKIGSAAECGKRPAARRFLGEAPEIPDLHPVVPLFGEGDSRFLESIFREMVVAGDRADIRQQSYPVSEEHVGKFLCASGVQCLPFYKEGLPVANLNPEFGVSAARGN